MDSGVVTRENSVGAGADVPAGAGVPAGGNCCVEVWLGDFSGLTSGDLVKLVLQADDARRRLDGYVAVLLVRIGELEGQDAVEELCRQFGLGRRRARQQAKSAGRLKALPDTLEAARQGWITVEHARLVAESHGRAPLSQDQELELITLAVSEDLDAFKKSVDHQEDRRHGDGGLSRRERQHQPRKARVFDADNDMVIVYAELERLAGERVKASLNALSDKMFRYDAKAGSDRTFEQRNADALVALITQQPAQIDRRPAGGRAISEGGCVDGSAGDNDDLNQSNGDQTGDDRFDGSNGDRNESGCVDGSTSGVGGLGCGPEPQATTLVVVVDYDTLSGQLQDARLIDGTPLSVDELRLIACDAGIVPAIFPADGQPLYLGRKQRTATSAQKLALGVRDKHCIGCAMRASACDAHHIIWWDKGGTTDMANLVLLCPGCHRKIHKHGYQATTTPEGQHRLEPPKRHNTQDQPRGPTQTTAA